MQRGHIHEPLGFYVCGTFLYGFFKHAPSATVAIRTGFAGAINTVRYSIADSLGVYKPTPRNNSVARRER